MELKGFTAKDTKRKFPEAYEDKIKGVNSGSVAPAHKAVVVDDNIVGVVGSKYQIVQNNDYFGTVEKAMLKTVPEPMQKGHVCRTISNGSWTQREHIFPEYKGRVDTKTGHVSNFGLRIIASNSYDGSSSAKLMAGMIDFYCTNGMVIGSDISQKARRHTSGLQVADFIQPLEVAITAASKGIDWVKKLAETPVKNDPLMALLEKHFSGRRASEMLARIDVERQVRGDNLFAVQSALTYYSSHQSSDFPMRGDNVNPRILEGREEEVGRIIRSREWAALEAA